SLFTHKDKPFSPSRVEAILRAIMIGPDLTKEQREQVINLLREYADCFALSISEVYAAEGVVHKLNIPEGTQFPKRVHQRPLSAPQCYYLHKKIDELLEAGVIKQCHPSDMKCVS
ncbi:hypothetical protein DAEQUDRAFT_658911, partial [Daedalea quercina L-15889]